jgi:uncharacterized protein (TIGR00661 family)
MRVLFIVQGEGRGHLTQAITMEQLLRSNGHEVVEVLVGKSKARKIPDFFKQKIHAPIRTFDSPNFLPTAKNKRSNILRSVIYNVGKTPTYLKSIFFLLSQINGKHVDLVINFYELLTGLAYLLARPQVPSVSIGHQYLFLHPDFQFPKGSPVSLFFLRWFTRVTCIGAQYKLALSFRNMPDNEEQAIKVVPPLIRREVLDCHPTQGNYLFGYMLNAGFSERVSQWHAEHLPTPLVFFWDKKGMPDEYRVDNTLLYHQLDDKAFLNYLAGCKAYATTAGFESVCEALYLHKPVLLVPAHIEQDCNAFDAYRSGAGVVGKDFELDQLLEFCNHYKPDNSFRQWVSMGRMRFVPLLEQASNMDVGRHRSLLPLLSKFKAFTHPALE